MGHVANCLPRLSFQHDPAVKLRDSSNACIAMSIRVAIRYNNTTTATRRRHRHGPTVPRADLVDMMDDSDFDFDSLFTFLAVVSATGIAIPTFFQRIEDKDKNRIEEIRDLNRSTLKATGETLTEDELNELRPTRHLDRREFKDDD